MQFWQLLHVIKLRCVKSAMKWRKLNGFTNSKRFLFRSLIINIKEDSAGLWRRTWKCTEILHYCGRLPKITISASEILPSRILTDKCTKQQPADQSWKRATTFSSFNLHIDQKSDEGKASTQKVFICAFCAHLTVKHEYNTKFLMKTLMYSSLLWVPQEPLWK